MRVRIQSSKGAKKKPRKVAGTNEQGQPANRLPLCVYNRLQPITTSYDWPPITASAVDAGDHALREGDDRRRPVGGDLTIADILLQVLDELLQLIRRGVLVVLRDLILGVVELSVQLFEIAVGQR